MAAKNKIEDMGLKYAGARKDSAQKHAINTNELPKLMRLSSLWTIPNWAEIALKSKQDAVRSMVFYILSLKINKTAYFNKSNFNYMSTDDAQEAIKIANDKFSKAINYIKELFDTHEFENEEFAAAYTEIQKLLVKYFFNDFDVTVFSKKINCSFSLQRCDQNLIKKLESVGFGLHTKFDIDYLFSHCEGKYGNKKIYLVVIGSNNKAYKCPDVGYIYSDRDENGLIEIKKKVVELNEAQSLNNIIFKNKEFHKRLLPCASDIRVGHDHLKGDELTPEKFMNDLKFKGVQFGNWVSDKERKDFLLATYNALADLMEIMGLPLHYASLDGRIGIAFGSRGKSNASAHYESSLRLISITKTKAIGNLAHEYFHALDHLIAENEGLGKFASTNTPLLGYAHSPVHGEIVRTLEKVTSGECMNTSKKFDGSRTKKYFSLKEEMMARTFEQWIEHMLEIKGQSNPFLVFDTIPNPSEEYSLYPLKNEMLEIAPYMQQLRDRLNNYFI